MENYVNTMAPLFGVLALLLIFLIILYTIGLWKVFTKMDEPGWKSIIPFYNAYTLYKHVFGDGKWFLLIFVGVIPFTFIGGILALLVEIITCFRLAKTFNQGTGFTIGLIFLGFIFMPILGFNDAVYSELPEFDIKHPFSI